MAKELRVPTTPCGMNRRDFVRTTAAAYSLYATAGSNPVFAAGAEDDHQ